MERDRYLELVRTVPLRPIGSEAELDRAIAMIDALLDKDKRSGDEKDHLDVLSDLVETYEDEHDPMPPVSGAEMLRFLI
jgi:HTH-type transcriptional regulator/antitoxin HigA